MVGGLILAFGLVESAAALDRCSPLAPPSGTILRVTPDQAGSLREIVGSAESGTTILLEDGYYDMSDGDNESRLVFSTPGVTLRSSAGDADAVILDGAYDTNELISVYTSDIVIADLTLKRAYHHPIHASGSSGVTIRNLLIHGVTIIDPGEQAIKINEGSGGGYVDFGVVECSRILLTDAGRNVVRNCYTGGIDAHKARGWVVRRNTIEGFWCQTGLSEHGIHFWSASRDTLIEENTIVNCARGIGLGLGESGASRAYPDNPYPNVGYLGHIDGVVRNNFVSAFDQRLFDSQFGFDAGVVLEQARGARVVHNTVGSTSVPFSSIEWRFKNTSVEIVNNLVTHNLRARADARAFKASNIDYADPGWFMDLESGDLHLSHQSIEPANAGTPLGAGVADFDIDHQERDSLPDIGADELGGDLVFRSGFESGDIQAWTSELYLRTE